MKKEHMKKMIAPIIITILIILYYLFIFGILIQTSESAIVKFLFGFVPLVLAVAMGYICVERIKEIRSGEEDDLSKY